jgi:hypothetical protein
MIRFLLLLFSTVVFFLLAAKWQIHDDTFQWAAGAASSFVASFLLDGVGPQVGSYFRRQ